MYLLTSLDVIMSLGHRIEDNFWLSVKLSKNGVVLWYLAKKQFLFNVKFHIEVKCDSHYLYNPHKSCQNYPVVDSTCKNACQEAHVA